MKQESKYHPLMAGKNWVEAIAGPECVKIMKAHRDVCEREISYVDSQGYIVTEKRFPREFLNKYYLYAFLRKNDRCPRCDHAEKILKSEKKKATRE